MEEFVFGFGFPVGLARIDDLEVQQEWAKLVSSSGLVGWSS